MKVRLLQKLLFVVAAISCSASLLWAQNAVESETHAVPPDQEAFNPMKFKALHEQLRVWAQRDVVPSLREWKTQFDGALSSEDLSRLNDLRTQAASLRQQRAALMPKMRDERIAVGRDEIRADDPAMVALHEQMKAINEKERALMPEVRKMAEKYQTNLQALTELAKPKVKMWIASATQQAEDYAKQNDVKLGHFRPEWMISSLPQILGSDKTPFRQHAAVRFMLWDGADIPELAASPLMQQMPAVSKVATNLSFSLNQNSPNPVIGNTTTISFALVQSDHVRITLIDQTGAQVAVICEQDFPAGQNMLQYTLGNFANGTYTYRLVCSQGTLSNTMTVLR